MAIDTRSAARASGSRPPAEARLWRRWLLVVTAGEAVGFLLPAAAAALGAAGAPGPLPLLLLPLAGAGEGAVLGWSQARVLRRRLPDLPLETWTARTAAAAALAWLLGLLPSSTADVWRGWPTAGQVGAAAVGGTVLLLSLGTAQWSVLRWHVAHAGRWIGWTAAGWLAGLVVFTAVATPLWHPGQDPVLVTAIGVLAGLLMASSMAAVTGAGAVRLAPVPRLLPRR
ncbi:hypothetical protein [Modestobacter sp. NPDC049651]|uniref:hypothetical protein n=1 Tax=unclassified Modestobacter TaxID=2643866 RepID=UPI0033D4F210